jgi:hypothetical protein
MRDERGLTWVCQTVETLKGDFKGGIKQNMMNLAAVSFPYSCYLRGSLMVFRLRRTAQCLLLRGALLRKVLHIDRQWNKHVLSIECDAGHRSSMRCKFHPSGMSPLPKLPEHHRLSSGCLT